MFGIAIGDHRRKVLCDKSLSGNLVKFLVVHMRHSSMYGTHSQRHKFNVESRNARNLNRTEIEIKQINTYKSIKSEQLDYETKNC